MDKERLQEWRNASVTELIAEVERLTAERDALAAQLDTANAKIAVLFEERRRPVTITAGLDAYNPG